MSGIVIDVDTNSQKAQKDLEAINKNIQKLVQLAKESSSSMSKAFNTTSVDRLASSALKANASVAKMGQSGNAAGASISQGADKANDSITRLVGSAKVLIATLAAGQGLSFFYKATDDLTGMQSKLRLVTKSTQEMLQAQRDLYDVSRNTRTALTDNVAVYTKFAQSLKNTATSADELNDITKTVQKTVALSGTSAQAANAAIVQFGQGLASGTLRGEELNSVMEQLPALATAIAEGMGLSIGELRKVAAEGKVTSAAVKSALGKMSESVDENFKKTSATAANGLTALGDSIKLATGQLGLFMGSSQRFYRVTTAIADGINSMVQNMIPALFTAEQGIKNYIGTLDMYSAAGLAIRQAWRFKISVFDVYSAHQEYSQMKGYLESFRALRDKIFNSKPKEQGLFDASSFKSMLGINEEVKTFGQRALEAFKLIGAAGYAFAGIFDKFKMLIPDIRGPLQEITSVFKRWYQREEKAADAFFVKYVRIVQRYAEAVIEPLSLFTKGDTALERAWVDVFKSSDVVDLTENLRDLGDELRNVRFDNLGVITKDIISFTRGYAENLKEILMFFNIIDNRILFINNIRFDRLFEGLKTFLSIAARIYDDVLYPALVVPTSVVKTAVLGVIDAVLDAINDNLNASVGERAGKAVYQAIVSSAVTIKNAIKKLFSTISDTDFSVGDIFQSTPDKLLEAIRNVGSTAKGFFRGLFGSIFENADENFEKLVDGVDSYTDKLLTGPLEKIKLFTAKVKEYFFDAYDAVVGHSYWPDLIDGVNAHTLNLGQSDTFIKRFADNVYAYFSEASEGVKGFLKGNTLELGEAKISTSGIDFGAFPEQLRKGLAVAFVSVFGWFFGGPFIKTLIADYLGANLVVGLTESIQGSFDGLVKSFANFLGEGVGAILDGLVNQTIKAFDTLVGILPDFVNGFISSIGRFGPVLSGLLSIIPTGGLIYTLIFGGATYATLTQKGAKDLKGILSGMGDVVKSFFNKGSEKAEESPMMKMLLGDKAALLTGLGIYTSAILQSVSGLDAFLVGTPFILKAIFGAEGAGRVMRDLALDVLPKAGSEILSWVAKMGSSLAGKSVLGNAIMGKASSAGKYAEDFLDTFLSFFDRSVAKTKTGLTKSLTDLVNTIPQIFKNIAKNKTAYNAGAISLSDMLFLESDITEDFLAGTTSGQFTKIKDKLSAVQKDVIDVFSSSSQSGVVARVKGYFTGIWEAITLSYQSGAIRQGLDFSNEILNSVKGSASAIRQGFAESFTSIRNEFAMTQNAAIDAFGMIVGVFADVRARMATMAASSGVSGLFGRLLMGLTGKTGILAIFALVITAFASTASAADVTSRAVDSLKAKIADLTITLVEMAAAAYAGLVAFRAYQAYSAAAAIGGMTAGFKAAGEYLRNWAAGIAAGFIALAKQSVVLISNMSRATVGLLRSAAAIVSEPDFWIGAYNGIVRVIEFITTFHTRVINMFVNMGAAIGRALAFAAEYGVIGFVRALGAAIAASVRMYGVAGTLIANFGAIGKAIVAATRLVLMLFTTVTGWFTIATVVAGGLLGLYLWGPEGTFLEKLEWAKDKIKGWFTDVDALTPRQTALIKALPNTEVAGRNVDFKQDFERIDTEKISSKDFKVYLDVAKTTNDTIDRMKELTLTQGRLTDAQLTELDNAIQMQRQMIANAPQIKITKDFMKAGQDLVSTLTYVDNSWSAGFSRLAAAAVSAMTSVASSEEQQVSFIEKMMTGLSVSYGVLKKGATDAVGAVSATISGIGSSISSGIGSALDAITPSFVKSAASWVGDIFSSVGGGIDSFFGTIGEGFDAFWTANVKVASAAKSAWLDAVKAVNSSVDSVRTIMFPKADANKVRESETIQDKLSTINGMKNFYSEAEMKQLTMSIKEYDNALKRLRAAEDGAVFTKNTAEIKKLRNEADLAGSNLQRMFDQAIDTGKLREAAEEYRSTWAQLILLSKDAIGMDITGNLGSDMFFDRAAEQSFGEIVKAGNDAFQKLKGGWASYAKELVTSAEVALPLKIDMEAAKRASDDFKEKAKQLAFFDTQVDLLMNVTGIEAAKEQVQDFFINNREGYEAWRREVELLMDAQRQLSKLSMLKATTPQEADEIAAKIADVISNIRRLKDVVKEKGPKKGYLEQLNNDLQKLNLTSVTDGVFANMDKELLQRLIPTIRKAAEEKAKFEKNPPTDFSEYIAQLRKILGLSADIAEQMKQMKPPHVQTAEALGVSNTQVAALSGKARERADSLGSRKSTLEKRINSGFDENNVEIAPAVLRAEALELKRIEKQSSKLFEEAAENIFERFSNAMQKAGVSLDFNDFVNLELSDQKVAKDIIAKMQAIRTRLNNAGGIYPSNAAWFKQQKDNFDTLQKRLESLQLNVKKSFSGMLSSIAESGYDINLDSAFYISDATVQRLIEISNVIATVTRNLGDKNFSGSIRGELQKLADARLEQRSVRDANAGFNEQISTINSQFADLKLTSAEFAKMGTEVRQQVYEAALKIKNGSEDLGKMTGEGATEAAAELEKAKIKLAAGVRSLVDPVRNIADGLVSNLGVAGVSVDRPSAQMLTRDQIGAFNRDAANIVAKQKEADDNVGTAAGIAAQNEVFNMREQLERKLKAATTKSSESPVAQASAAFAQNITDAAVNGFKDVLSGKKTPKEYLKGIVTTFADNIVNTFVEGLTAPLTSRNGVIQTALRNFGAGIFGVGAKGANAAQGVTSEAGGLFSGIGSWISGLMPKSDSSGGGLFSTIGSWFGVGGQPSSATVPSGTAPAAAGGASMFGMAGGIGAAGCCYSGADNVAGKATEKAAESAKAATTGVFDEFKTKISEAFTSVQGSVSSFFSSVGENTKEVFGGITDSLGSMASSMGGTVSSMFDGFSDSFSSMFAGLGDSLSSIGSDLMGMLSGASGGGGDGGWMSLLSLFLADGGQVSGPGTSRSDSIPAMLSNGEFVVNADSTKKHSKLLHAINEGRIPKFADGGIVGTSADSSVVSAINDNTSTSSSQSSMGGSQQVFNINITGDVSRQTRAEIQKMIPNIATGVGAFNREKGNRK